MISINGVVIWTWPGASAPGFVRTGERHRFEMPVRSLERAIRFYRRVFGFDAKVDPVAECATIAAAPNAELLLDAGASSVDRSPVQVRWSFLVTDLDLAREAAWDLSVRPARDSGAPDQIYRGENMSSLYVADPDGNPIELIEIRTAVLISWSEPRRLRRRACTLTAPCG